MRFSNSIIIGILSAFLLSLTAYAEDGGKVKWETDYAKGMSAAKKSGKAVMLYFTADW